MKIPLVYDLHLRTLNETFILSEKVHFYNFVKLDTHVSVVR